MNRQDSASKAQHSGDLTFQRVRDVYETAACCREQLRDKLREIRCSREPAPEMTVLELLEEDERQTAAGLRRALEESEPAILDTWLQYVPDEETRRTLTELNLSAEMPVEDIVGRKQRFDQALAAMYRQLAREVSAERVVDIFNGLADEVDSRAARASWSTRGSEESIP